MDIYTLFSNSVLPSGFFFVVLPSSTYLFTVNVQDFDFSLDHTQAHITFGRTPLDEGSARRRDLITQTLYKTNIHGAGGIRTHDPSKQVFLIIWLRVLVRCIDYLISHFIQLL
jgi:hypothetical protein